METDRRKYAGRYFLTPVLVLLCLLCIFAPSYSISANRSHAKGDASQSKPAAHGVAAKSKIVKHKKAHHGKRGSVKKAHVKAAHKKSHSRKSKSANKEQIGIFTAYTSKAGKRAGRAHKTADGTDLKTAPSCVLANNKMPMGTKIRIEGVGTCEVRDRIGKKVRANRFDIYMNDDFKWAKDFGKKKLKYTVENRGKTARSRS